MTAEDIKRVYGAIRKIVPENIELVNGCDYDVHVNGNLITISEAYKIIYMCRFKMPEKENE